MKGRKQSVNLAAALGIFLLAFGALAFYLQYEGVITYEYLFAEQPDLVLTPADADQLTVLPESAHSTAYAQNQHMVFRIEKQSVGAVRVHYANQVEPYTTATIHYTLSDTQETHSMNGVSRKGGREVVFSIPQHEYDQISVEINDLCGVERIEVYAQSYYADESKRIPTQHNIGVAFLLSALLAIAFVCSDVDLRSGKGFGFPALYLMLEVAALRYVLQIRTYDAYRAYFEGFIWIAFVLVSAILWAMYRMLLVRRVALHRVFALGGLTMGVIMMLLIQPFGVPDEGTHYREAYMRSNDFLGKSAEQEHEIRETDLRFYERAQEMGMTTKHEKYAVLAEEFQLFNDNEETGVFVREGRIKSVPLGYVFSGLGMTVARLLNLSGAMLFYMGRLANLMIYVAVMTLAIYWLPFGKAAAMAVAMAPVAMQQAASYSYDAVVMAVSFLFVSYALRLYAQEKNISMCQYGLCMALAVLLGPSKAVYAPLSMAVLLIPAKKYGFGKAKWLLNLLVIAAAFGTMLVMQMGMVMRITSMGVAAERAATGGYTLSYIVSNIRQTISMYLRTFEVHSDFYFNYLFSQYLGWHEFSAYGWLTAFSSILFVLGSQQTENETELTIEPWKRWGAIVVFVGVIVITQLTLLMNWTPMGFAYIEGVQGRYFIPALVVLIPVLRNAQVRLSEQAHRWCALLTMWASLFATINLLQVMPK